MTRSATRVGLLVAGHVDPKSVHIAGDYPELFDALLGPFGIELVCYDLDHGRFPGSLRECDGWICSPSRSSTYDELEWLPDAEELHREIAAGEHAYVGICFGHQLLAQALGGEVARAPGGWGVGVTEYEIVESMPWMAPGRSTIALLASHQDQVVALPPGARSLATATNGSCPIAGMAVGERAWTLQPHPEFVPELADHLLAGRTELIGAERVARARASLGRPLDRTTVAAWIGAFFTGRAA
jgi:GMP synthase-like glutamine amidotransferase